MFSVETYFIVVQNTSIGNQNNKICQHSNPTEGTPLTGVWDPALFPPYFHWNLHTAERVKSIKLSSILWENVSIHFCIMGSIDAPESCVCSCPTVSRGSPGYRDRINRKHRLPCLLCMKTPLQLSSRKDYRERIQSISGLILNMWTFSPLEWWRSHSYFRTVTSCFTAASWFHFQRKNWASKDVINCN